MEDNKIDVVDMGEAKISVGTIIRTVCLAITLINQILAAFGKSPIPVENEQISLLISTAATIVTAVVAWWKNNSFTQNAQIVDKILKQLKRK